MNVKILHFKCQSVVRDAYLGYRICIENAIFDVDDSIIQIELKEMKQIIGTKMNTWCADCNFTEKHYDYMQNVIKYYTDIATKKAIIYGNKHHVIEKENKTS